jgi:hypothetical protein
VDVHVSIKCSVARVDSYTKSVRACVADVCVGNKFNVAQPRELKINLRFLNLEKEILVVIFSPVRKCIGDIGAPPKAP